MSRPVSLSGLNIPITYLRGLSPAITPSAELYRRGSGLQDKHRAEGSAARPMSDERGLLLPFLLKSWHYYCPQLSKLHTNLQDDMIYID